MVVKGKGRMEGTCPVKGCNAGCFLSETRSGTEMSFFCRTGQHRGFISKVAFRESILKGDIELANDQETKGGKSDSSVDAASELERLLGI